MSSNIRRTILIIFAALALASGYFMSQLKFEFYLEQFFPENDEGLAFFQEFVKDFETDVNFLLVAVEREEGVFEQNFLNNFHQLTLQARDLPYIKESMSLNHKHVGVEHHQGDGGRGDRARRTRLRRAPLQLVRLPRLARGAGG